MAGSDDVATAPSSGPAAVATRLQGSERYMLVRRIGEGAMGVVWAARDRTLDRMVAFKVLHDQYLGALDQERLAGEARTMARLSHPNVVAVYDVGEREGRTFVTMELVEGMPLSRWLETARPWRTVVDVFRAAGEGLAAAHDAGIVHRDVKPGNILVGDDGRVRVADFGIAREASDAPPRDDSHDAPTGVGAKTTGIVGTPAYMSPERLRGEPAGPLGDQFGFCVAFYEALHGRRPFDGATLDALRASIEAGVPPPVRDVPGWLHDVVARGLAADPAARFPTMRDLLVALRGPRHRRRLVALTGGSIVVIASIAAVVTLGRNEPVAECADAGRRVADVWNPAVRMRLTAAFGTSGLPSAVPTWLTLQRTLDRVALDWADMSDAACRATRVDHTQSQQLFDRRQLCLDQRLRGLQHFIAVIERPDAAMIEKAPSLLRSFAPITDCADPAYLTSLAGANATAARGDLPAIQVALATGTYREGIAIADRVIAAARAQADRALEAEALVLRGRLAMLAGDAPGGAETLGKAIALAGEIGSTRTRVDGWLALSEALQMLGRLPEAEEPLAFAEQALRDAPDTWREADLAGVRGTLRGRQSRFADAAAQFELALTQMAAVFGADSPALVPQLKNLAVASRLLDKIDDAERHLRRAVELASALGPTHPTALSVRRELAIVWSTQGRLDDYVTELRALLAVRQRLHPEGDLTVANAHDDVAVAVAKLGKFDEALVHHRAALALRERLAPDSPDTWTIRANVALTLQELGRPAEAEPLLRDVLATREKQFGRMHQSVALGRAYLGDVLAALDRFDEAIAAYREARAIYSKLLGPEHASVARTLAGEAAVERKRKRTRAALALDSKALAIRERALPAGNAAIVRSLIAVAADHLELHAVAKAVEVAERAVTGAGEGRNEEAASARWVLARALTAARRDPERALALANDARARLAERPGVNAKRELAEIDAWLATRAR